MNGHHPSSREASSVPTTALTSVLANPYAHHFSSHYYQAYVQAYRPRTTADGYTLSSTYVPGTSRITPTIPTPSPRDRPSVRAQSQAITRPIQNHLTFGSWYQPGNCRCTRQGCPFTGSRKSVEIHMMDRHFIFPHGWEKKDDWDAEPSLRGKPIAIQGTSLVLDTPEAINAWISERRRRFPTDENVRDKKRKLEEAVARGQLTLEDIGAGARKRYRQNAAEGGNKGYRGRGHQRGRGFRQGLTRREKPRTEIVNGSTDEPVGAKTEYAREATPTSIVEVDEAPEVMSSKIPTSPCTMKVEAGHNTEVQMSHAYTQECTRKISRPKKPPQNPFLSQSTLLRNLLLPEIRTTVSNLSQAIRFLVENDFLCNVELRPGEVQRQMIEVLESSETACPTHPATPEE